jgi:SAM-dependent methyltransferase
MRFPVKRSAFPGLLLALGLTLGLVGLGLVGLGLVGLGLGLAGAGPVQAQDAAEVYKPEPHMPGRDVPWVPTPPALVDKMLDMVRLTPQDVVVDLGSGDGRNVIAAARRGARARGVEYNAKLVELSKRLAAEAGVAGTATFIEGDMFQADISDATVLPLFLLTENLDRLLPKFLALRPGTRIVNNGFEFTEWDYDEVGRVEGTACGQWCTAYLYIVPARVEGTWRTGDGELVLEQKFQWISGTLTSAGKRLPIERGRVQGDVIRFNVGDERYTGRVNGDTIDGRIANEFSVRWRATR